MVIVNDQRNEIVNVVDDSLKSQKWLVRRRLEVMFISDEVGVPEAVLLRKEAIIIARRRLVETDCALKRRQRNDIRLNVNKNVTQYGTIRN